MDERKKVQVQLRVRPGFPELMKKEAERRGLTVSVYVEKLVYHGISFDRHREGRVAEAVPVDEYERAVQDIVWMDWGDRPVYVTARHLRREAEYAKRRLEEVGLFHGVDQRSYENVLEILAEADRSLASAGSHAQSLYLRLGRLFDDLVERANAADPSLVFVNDSWENRAEWEKRQAQEAADLANPLYCAWKEAQAAAWEARQMNPAYPAWSDAVDARYKGGGAEKWDDKKYDAWVRANEKAKHAAWKAMKANRTPLEIELDAKSDAAFMAYVRGKRSEPEVSNPEPPTAEEAAPDTAPDQE